MPENGKKPECPQRAASESLHQALAEADVQGHSDEDTDAGQDMVITLPGGTCI